MAIDNRIVGGNISRLRIKKGMTQFQLAAALNVSHQAVSKWETGSAIPDIQTLLNLTQLFGVSMEALLNTEIDFAEDEETVESAPQEETTFTRWVNDIVPENAKNAFRSAASEAKKTFQEVGVNLSACAGETFEKAVKYARKVGAEFENHFAGENNENQANEAQEEPVAQVNGNAEQPASGKRFPLEQILRMAPFMSRAKLSELVTRFSDVNDLESIIQIAPFLEKSAIQALIERCMNKEVDLRTLCRLAPFAGADALYQLILSNIDMLDWKTVEALAPFLKRSMVDRLAEYMITGVLTEDMEEKNAGAGEKKSFQETVRTVKDEIGSAVGGVMGEIQNVFGEIGSKFGDQETIRSVKDEIGSAVGGVMDEIQNVFGGLGSKFGGIFTSDEEETDDLEEDEDFEEPSEEEAAEENIPAMEEIGKTIPSMEEIEKNIPPVNEIVKEAPSAEETAEEAPAHENAQPIENAARHALETGAWAWLRDHANEIEDEDLLCEIAVAAVSNIAQTESSVIVMKIAHRLTDAGKRRLFEKVAAESAWELAAAIHPLASETDAAVIIEKAARAEGIDREDAYLAIECYSKIASKEVIAAITDEAIRNDNWVLINALTDVM